MQADDLELVNRWLYGRSEHTQRVYRTDVAKLRQFVGKPLAEVTLEDLQRFDQALMSDGLSPASRERTLAAIKSLYRFGCDNGLLPHNPASSLRLPKTRDRLSERILFEADVKRLIDSETDNLARLVLRTLYSTGLRVSELCNLRWGDIRPRGVQSRSDFEPRGKAAVGFEVPKTSNAVLSIYGKGSRQRYVNLPAAVSQEMLRLKEDAAPDDPVFWCNDHPITPNRVRTMVKRAGRRVGLPKVSPHWLRHAHASHALDRGCPIHLVQQTLGHSSLATTGKYLHCRPDVSSGDYLDLGVRGSEDLELLGERS